MELFPRLEIGWLYGWILLAIEFLIQGFLLLIFPKVVVSRLFDRSGWNTKQRIFTIVGKIFSLVCLALIFLTSIKVDSGLFMMGLSLYAAGIVGLVAAMLNFRDTPPDQPVTRGIYKISRHPQIFSQFIIFLGICMAIGSWPALLALLLSRFFQHFSILAEEEVCLKRYGESYRAFMEGVPRYFLFSERRSRILSIGKEKK
jgi:protein-S-isoprenylcysteine O-methyltransferase Ste14